MLGIYGNFTGTARSSVSLAVPVVLVSFFATVDAATERIFAQIVSLQGRRRGLATLTLFLNDVIGRFAHRLCDFAERVSRRSLRSLRRFVLRHVSPLTDKRNVLIDYVVLQISRTVVVRLRQLRSRTASSFVLPLRAG